jgi:hypothetical protein
VPRAATVATDTINDTPRIRTPRRANYHRYPSDYREREQELTKDDFDALTTQLPDVFDRVLDFVGTALATRGHYDNIAYWVEQTYKAVQKLGRVSSTATTPLPTTSTTPSKPTWAQRLASLPPRLTEDETTLRQMKV